MMKQLLEIGNLHHAVVSKLLELTLVTPLNQTVSHHASEYQVTVVIDHYHINEDIKN